MPSPATPSSTVLPRYQRIETHDFLAVSSDPTSEPMLVTDSTNPKLPSPPQRTSASLGSDTP